MVKYGKHYVDIGMTAEYMSGEPAVMEPAKLESWDWYPKNTPPGPLFGCVSNYIEATITGKTYFANAN